MLSKSKSSQFNYVIEKITRKIFNTNFSKFIILHFYIFITAMFFLVLTYVLHNDRASNSNYK